MTTIIPHNLYLGDINNGRDSTFLMSKGIKNIIRIIDPDAYVIRYDNVQYHTYYLYDDVYENIKDVCKHAYEDYLDRQEGAVLVHCHAGMSRSVCVTAYILVREGVCSTLQEAIDFIKSRRSRIAPAPWFIDQIEGLLEEEQKMLFS
jgi:protein-tyrosine phosphatase